MDAKQDVCWNMLQLGAKQDFCSDILGAKQKTFVQTCWMQCKTFISNILGESKTSVYTCRVQTEAFV